MKIAIVGGKGGTGKSTVSVALAVESAKRRKTMLVDCDVECPNDALLLGADLKTAEKVKQPIPKWDIGLCKKCGACARACKQDAIVFVEGKPPAFVSDRCIGCGACIFSCPASAISETTKDIGVIALGKSYGVDIVSGELYVGELASGEVVADLRRSAEKMECDHQIILIDAPAGIACPVIASIVGVDLVVAVTEPTPSALHDLKRVIHLTKGFDIPCRIIVNKSDLDEGFFNEIARYAKEEGLDIIGKIPYSKDFVESTVSMVPINRVDKRYSVMFADILNEILPDGSQPPK